MRTLRNFIINALGILLILGDILLLLKEVKYLDWLVYILSIILGTYLLVVFHNILPIILILIINFYIVKYFSEITDDIEDKVISYLLLTGLSFFLLLSFTKIYISETSNYKTHTEGKIIKNVKYRSEYNNYIIGKNDIFEISEKEYMLLKANNCKDVVQLKNIKINTTYSYIKPKLISTIYKCYK